MEIVFVCEDGGGLSDAGTPLWVTSISDTSSSLGDFNGVLDDLSTDARNEAWSSSSIGNTVSLGEFVGLMFIERVDLGSGELSCWDSLSE